VSEKKISKAAAIKSILSDLKRGIDKAVILDKLGKSCSNSRSSFYNYYDEAEKLHIPYLNKIREVENKTMEKVITKEITSLIMSKLDRQILLTKIATGDLTTWKDGSTKDGVQRMHAFDPIKAIDILNKMDGAYGVEEKIIDDIKPIVFRVLESGTNSDD
jgi:hypothetical protein